MRIGFGGCLDEEPGSGPTYVGDVGQLTTTSGSDDDDAEVVWEFKDRRVLLAIKLGPFSLVIGSPE